MRCGTGTKLGRKRLGVSIIEKRPRHVPVRYPELHIREGIGQVGVAQLIQADCAGVVRVDRYQSDALILVIVVDRPDAGLVILRDGAVVGLKDNGEHLGMGVLAQSVNLVIHPPQIKIRCRGTDRQDRVRKVGLNAATAAPALARCGLSRRCSGCRVLLSGERYRDAEKSGEKRGGGEQPSWLRRPLPSDTPLLQRWPHLDVPFGNLPDCVSPESNPSLKWLSRLTD